MSKQYKFRSGINLKKKKKSTGWRINGNNGKVRVRKGLSEKLIFKVKLRGVEFS